MKRTADFLWDMTKGFRLMFAELLLTVLITALTSASFSMVIGRLVDVIWYDQNFRLFFLYFGLYAGLYLINLSFHGGLNYLWARLKVTYLADIRRRLYAYLLHTDSRTLSQMRSGDMMKRLDEDVECILEFLHRCCFYVIENGIHYQNASPGDGYPDRRKRHQALRRTETAAGDGANVPSRSPGADSG